MVDPDKVMRLASVIAGLRPLAPDWPPPEPDGWEHLPLSLVDTTFSLQATYSRDGEVFPPVRRYAEWAAQHVGMPSWELLATIRGKPSRGVHLVRDMVRLLDPLTTRERVEVFGSRRPASTSPGAPRRADTVVEAAHVLTDLGVETRYDFEDHYADPERFADLRRAWLGIHGFGKRSWEYVTLRCGLPGVTAAVHVARFVTDALGADHPVAPEEARALVLAATDDLRLLEPAPGWNLGGVEDLIWRAASGRSPL